MEAPAWNGGRQRARSHPPRCPGEGLGIGLETARSTGEPSGSFNMCEEATCGRRVAEEADAALSAEALWRMATVNGAYALGVEDQFGSIEPGLRADLMLIEHAGGDPHETVLTATDEEVLATWIDGHAVLVSEQLDEALGADDCVALDGTAPRVCGVLGAFGLSVVRFTSTS